MYMDKYLVAIRIQSQVVKTIIYADSTIHAKLLAEWNYGIGSVTNTPQRLAETQTTPQQQRVNQLKQQLDTAKRTAKVTKFNQQQQKLNQQRANLNKLNK